MSKKFLTNGENKMKSIKMSRAIREQITYEMKSAWIKNNPAKFDMKKERKKVGDWVWNKAYGNVNFGDTPNELLNTQSSIYFFVGSECHNFIMSELKASVRKGYDSSPDKTFDKNPRILNSFLDKRSKHDDWLKEKSSFVEQINQIVNSVNTTKQLVEIWPEAEQYLPAYANDPSKGINLPALKTSMLNAALGIKND
jgi:hypothetical protein